MNDYIGALHPTPPYDFHKTVIASRYYTTLGALRDGAYWRALRTGDGLALVEVASTGTVDAPALEVYLRAATNGVDRNALLDKLARMFHAADLTPFYRLAQDDPALWRVVEPLRGLHILQTETLFEAVTITVIEQQIALAAAQKAERWLVGWAGDSIAHNGDLFYTFPRPERLAASAVEDLTPLKITFRRMGVVIELARLEAEHSLERLRLHPPDEAYATLVRLKGVGHWTAAWTLTRGLGQYVYVGSADVALRAAVNHYFFNQRGRCAADVTDALYARYGQYAGLAAVYTLMKWALDKYPVWAG